MTDNGDKPETDSSTDVGADDLAQENLVWDFLRITMPALVFVVIFLTLVIVVKMNFWVAGAIAFAAALADYLLFAYLKKKTSS